MIKQKNPSGTYRPSYDRTPRYTVKQVAEMMEMSAYTIRYYENAGLIPDVDRSGGNARMFSDYTLGWLRLVHCLRMTGLPIEGVKHYIDLCQEGDSTIPERAELIFKQEKSLREQLRILKKTNGSVEIQKNLSGSFRQPQAGQPQSAELHQRQRAEHRA